MRPVPDGQQIDFAVIEASRKVAAEGYEKADLRDVFLAGLGWLAYDMRMTQSQGIHIHIKGKAALVTGLFVGGVLVAAGPRLVQMMLTLIGA